MTTLESSLAGPRHGVTFEPSRDAARLNSQALRVYNAMSDGIWRGLSDIRLLTGDPEASISARLRDIRALGITVERKYIVRGLHHYRLVLPRGQMDLPL